MTRVPHPTPLYYATCDNREGVAVQLGPLQYFMPELQLDVYVVPLHASLVVRGEVLGPEQWHFAKEFARRLRQTVGQSRHA